MHVRHALTAAATAASVLALGLAAAAPAQAAEYSSALKIKGVQYDAPGSDSNKCSGGNTKHEYLTIKNYSRTATVNLRGYVVKDAVGNKFTFPATHKLQPG
ncbi:lamin tail domain-containing protein, partial [Streptomyces rubiginosohelvolus]|uniref:lamin tail domain-containing protein n=1 Tax=Streptomyces rubiginosohelvolus TaxID=67362 RepID=UPI0016766CA5